MKKVVIFGAGVMGASMTLPFCDRSFDVRLVGTHLDGAIIDSLKAKKFHPKLNVTLPQALHVYSHDELSSAIGNDTDLVMLGVSSLGVEYATEQLVQVLKAPVPILMITKGMHPEPSSLTTLPDRVAAVLKEKLGFEIPVAAIGGP